jgi:hypothetical protein
MKPENETKLFYLWLIVTWVFFFAFITSCRVDRLKEKVLELEHKQAH